nr:MAG TPA: hypothetical protein [Podoviridae sp. ct1Pw90]
MILFIKCSLIIFPSYKSAIMYEQNNIINENTIIDNNILTPPYIILYE